MADATRLRRLFSAAPSLPRLQMDDATEPAELRRHMRMIIDHPVVRSLPYAALLGPMLACILILVLTGSPGLAIGLALLLYAQLSRWSSGFVLRSIWATTTIALRNALNGNAMSKDTPEDVRLVDKTAKALRAYAIALLYVIPGLNVLVALIVLALAFAPGAPGLPASAAIILLGVVTLSVVLAFIPNRTFVRHAHLIMVKSREVT